MHIQYLVDANYVIKILLNFYYAANVAFLSKPYNFFTSFLEYTFLCMVVCIFYLTLIIELLNYLLETDGTNEISDKHAICILNNSKPQEPKAYHLLDLSRNTKAK